jgi:hypothetical protein
MINCEKILAGHALGQKKNQDAKPIDTPSYMGE